MRTQEIYFLSQRALCVFPDRRLDLPQAISELWLDDNYPVIVLIGGEIDKECASATQQALQTISRIAEDLNAVVICGGTDMGIMAEIGRIRSQNRHKFPLVGITLQELATWPGGPQSAKFLWWGENRLQLEPHHSHFILVPGSQFGDESPWIADTAAALSRGHRSVTILINGGEVSRKDIELSLENRRPVIALSHTGRLADEFARQPNRHKLITIVPAHAGQRIVKLVEAALSVHKSSGVAPSLVDLLLLEAFAKAQSISHNAFSKVEEFDGVQLPYDEYISRTAMEDALE